MRRLRSNDGIAIILALILGVVSIAFLSAVMKMISTGARMSGMERSYSSAVEASTGGANIMMRYLTRQTDLEGYSWLTIPGGDDTCLQFKRGHDPTDWTTSPPVGGGCPENCQDHSQLDDITGDGNYDIKLETSAHNVYVKLVDTKEYQTGEGTTAYMYTVHAVSVSKQNQDDKSWITFVYRINTHSTTVF